MTAGVYWFYQSSKDRAVYVGSSNDLDRRRKEHVGDLRRGNHRNIVLQRAWNKYGAPDLEFRVLEECAPERRVEREEFWMNAMPAWPIANLSAEGSATESSPETRRKISEKLKGHPVSDEVRRKMSAARMGRKFGPLSDAQKQKLSVLRKGKKLTAAQELTRPKFAKGHTPWNKGTGAVKVKRVGPRVVSEETRLKVSQTLTGHKRSPEEIQKSADARRGAKRSPETRQRMSEAARARKRKAQGE